MKKSVAQLFVVFIFRKKCLNSIELPFRPRMSGLLIKYSWRGRNSTQQAQKNFAMRTFCGSFWIGGRLTLIKLRLVIEAPAGRGVREFGRREREFNCHFVISSTTQSLSSSSLSCHNSPASYHSLTHHPDRMSIFDVKNNISHYCLHHERTLKCEFN